ncbi:MAG: T9SS type A sorting domain-containing protein [Bernardetiaceae bacterium]|nr:T9SS type A sorting domain-containing protein [Bernardetiaceae bacterium]
MVGNPYPSPLRLSALFNDNNNLTTGISGTAWFWQDDNNGTGTGNFTAVNGVTNPTAQAAVGQSFYVLANGTSGILAFTNAQRQAGNPVFYREEGEPMERLRLEVTGAGTRDELWAAFAPSFTQGFERGYDAEKLEGDTRLSLSAVTAHGRLAVAALPPATTGQFELPLQLMARQAGTYTFAASLVQSGGRNLALEDRQTGQLYHLQPGQAHTLALAAGTYRDRFYLREAGTGPQNNTQAGEAAHAYAFGRELFVAAGAEAEVRVYNLLGVELARFAGVPPGGPRRLAVGVPAPGVYVVKVATASGTVQQRVWLEH